jgi:hypothetical protein
VLIFLTFFEFVDAWLLEYCSKDNEILCTHSTAYWATSKLFSGPVPTASPQPN